MSATGVIAPRLRGRGGRGGGLLLHPLCRPFVGRGFSRPSVRGVLSLWQSAGRRPSEGGGG